MGQYIWPCPSCTSVNSKFGYRIHPIYGTRKLHSGIDIPASNGKEIYATRSGTVNSVQTPSQSGGYGNFLIVDHGGGVQSCYAHCQKVLVSKGQSVAAGSLVALVGSTGNSTGPHLHFEIRENGTAQDPLSYVSANDTKATYTGSAGTASNTVTVKALFTAYYPFNDALQGGYYDALGNLLDPSKNTCAAPKEIPFGTKITVQGTGTSLDGRTYTVTDRGSAITVVNNVYHFDILMSTHDEAYGFGKHNGTAIIGDGAGAESTSGNLPITSIVQKSISGQTGAPRFTALRKQDAILQTGCEILIQANEVYLASPIEEITLQQERFGSPSTLTFKVLKDETLDFVEGNAVTLRVDGAKIFYGYVFKKSRTRDGLITVTCYDQLRYLKNKDTIIYDNKKYSELLKEICGRYNLQTGTIADTEYVIPHRLEESCLYDMLGYAAQETTLNTGKRYILYDDAGSVCLCSVGDMLAPVLIDKDTAENFDYTSTIDEETYNRVVLAYDNGDTGERELYIANDAENQSAWGILQYYDNESNGASSLEAKSKALLNYYNKKQRKLTVKGCFGSLAVRAGSVLPVVLNLGDLEVSHFMMAERIKHVFRHQEHTMDITLVGARGNFVA